MCSGPRVPHCIRSSRYRVRVHACPLHLARDRVRVQRAPLHPELAIWLGSIGTHSHDELAEEGRGGEDWRIETTWDHHIAGGEKKLWKASKKWLDRKRGTRGSGNIPASPDGPRKLQWATVSFDMLSEVPMLERINSLQAVCVSMSCPIVFLLENPTWNVHLRFSKVKILLVHRTCHTSRAHKFEVSCALSATANQGTQRAAIVRHEPRISPERMGHCRDGPLLRWCQKLSKWLVTGGYSQCILVVCRVIAHLRSPLI